jgi:arylsulfatase A
VAATIDMLPTLAHLTGGKVPDDRTLDGRNIWPLMEGAAGAKSPHEAYILVHGGRVAVRSGPWKFYPWPEGSDRRRPKNQPPQPVKGPPVQLYDIANDIAETTNVAEQHPEVVERLKAAARAFQEELKQNRRPVGRLEPGKG